MEAFAAGTLAGAGSFRCEGCGYGVALHELDEVPECPQCGGSKFKRASMFLDPRASLFSGTRSTQELEALEHVPEVSEPDWLDEARDALVADGDYVGFEVEGRVRVMPLQDGWTRVGRSLSAHIRFDDPTVSRRHALIHRDRTGARVLDDRSLNGVFLNEQRVDWRELEDGDEITIGAFRLYFMRVRSHSGVAAQSATAAD